MEKSNRRSFNEQINEFPWWLMVIGLIFIVTIIQIINTPTYNEAFTTMRLGITTTITITLIAYGISLIIGLFVGLGRVSKGVVVKNIATFYVEVVRGIPMLVLIFFIALVVIPGAIEFISLVGEKFVEIGWMAIGKPLAGINIRMISMSFRAIVALSITYGAFSAEIYRAGIQSVHPGQIEAARSQGMSYGQAMRHVILPQAIRNVLPAIGNDFIAMLKDSSLVSLLAVRDVTHLARLYAGGSFRFTEAYTILAVLYLSMTILLSLVVKYIEKRISTNDES
ncbi:MAG: amino acid ABC transporter permease [Anaerolineaceae bacterium]|nr:amino acid ABC transporter permease [Anaerolineaceae bacterium]